MDPAAAKMVTMVTMVTTENITIKPGDTWNQKQGPVFSDFCNFYCMSPISSALLMCVSFAMIFSILRWAASSFSMFLYSSLQML